MILKRMRIGGKLLSWIKVNNKKQLKDFGIVFGVGFPLFFGFLIPILFHHELKLWTIWLGLVFILVANLKPKLLYYPYTLWMKIGLVLGWINSRIILASIFIFVLQPIALIMKITGYDPLKKKVSNTTTYKETKKNYKINLNKIF